MHAYGPTPKLQGNSWILREPVRVEEKIDGAQFSFGVGRRGLEMRGKAGPIDRYNAPTFWQPVVPEMERRQAKMVPGVIYRGEYVNRKNDVSYDTKPPGLVVLWGAEPRPGVWMDRYSLGLEALSLGLEPAQSLGYGRLREDSLLALARAAKPQLGGTAVEGVVVKRGGKRAKLRLCDYTGE